MRTAVIEVGGTTTRAVVAEPTPGRGHVVHLDRRIVLGLQRAIDRDGEVGEGLRLLVAETVRRLAQECRRHGAARLVAAVDATVAVASDRDDLVRLLDRTLQVPVRVRSVLDEARLLLHAVGIGPGTGPAVVADIGERHTRLVRRDPRGLRVQDLPGPSADATVARDLVAAHHGTVGYPSTVVPEPDQRGPATSPPVPVVTGPVTAAVGRTLLHRRYGPLAPPPDRLRVGPQDLAALDRELTNATPTQRLLLPAVDPEEADLVTLGTAYLLALVDRLEVRAVEVSLAATTDGQVLEALGLDTAPGARRAAAVTTRTRTGHARRTAHLATALAGGLAGALGWTAADRALLVDAARLHDGGDPIDHTDPERRREHAEHLVRHGLPGTDPTTVVELACLVWCHQGPPPGDHVPIYPRLPAARRHTVTELAAALRLACALDRGTPAAVEAVRVRVTSDQLAVLLLADAPVDATLAAVAAEQGTIEQALRRVLAVCPATPLAAPPVVAPAAAADTDGNRDTDGDVSSRPRRSAEASRTGAGP
ncbi:hypothetical protein [Egicoccus halophilus]|uniref:Ppx/GppA phosphatase C-terminal domain-containing protein n=1 Tax=Egicoccus halophilus TaxID=1670830 RepID=A0A8J3ET81_9ACTN|nr:hypothetical protein [Egicoccus halophilus]GGI08983.1 hypothetical protein GCM10011354_31810 [Egicoccus halophilus]